MLSYALPKSPDSSVEKFGLFGGKVWTFLWKGPEFVIKGGFSMRILQLIRERTDDLLVDSFLYL